MARARKLSGAMQLFVVRELARFASPSEVVDSVKEVFGVELSRQAVQHYDPEHGSPPAKFKQVFAHEREKARVEVETIGVAHIGVRLRLLDRMVRQAMARKNYPLARDLLESAAKEVGGMFTNKRDVRVGLTVDDMLKQLATEDGDGSRGTLPTTQTLG